MRRWPTEAGLAGGALPPAAACCRQDAGYPGKAARVLGTPIFPIIVHILEFATLPLGEASSRPVQLGGVTRLGQRRAVGSWKTPGPAQHSVKNCSSGLEKMH